MGNTKSRGRDRYNHNFIDRGYQFNSPMSMPMMHQMPHPMTSYNTMQQPWMCPNTAAVNPGTMYPSQMLPDPMLTPMLRPPIRHYHAEPRGLSNYGPSVNSGHRCFTQRPFNH
ncbi:hypothetical protein GJ496_000059 [Pomphorhynchus laevis]|nr:hypothetical protein GJ496_000059 [Pomphorhynchus laevis]